MKPPHIPETPAEKYARKQRERAAAAAAQSKKDRKREKARGFQRPPVSEEKAEAARRRVHERLFPWEADELQALIDRQKAQAIVTDVAVRKSQEDARLSMMGPEGKVALSRRETIEEILEKIRTSGKVEGIGP